MGYAVFEHPSQPLARTESLAAAFTDVLARAGRAASWSRRPGGGEITLQFIHLHGPRKGELVGAETGEPETYSAPSGGGQEFARRLIMAELVKLGIDGYFACKEADLERAADAA